MARTNFVFIDFENVQPKDMELLIGGPFKVKVFLGSTQTRLPVELVRVLQPFGQDAEYIQIDGSGNNALDFHIAYYIGRLAAEFPDGFFHIISKDTGFDPLIKHLKEKNIYCLRSTAISDIPLLIPPKPADSTKNTSAIETATTPQASKPGQTSKVDSVIQKLISQKASKPRKLKTLGSTIKAHFANQLANDELQQLIVQLTKQGIIKVADGNVTYKLPS